MSNNFNSLRFEFQDCSDFLAGLDKDETSSSSLYTPSPQEILNGVFPDDFSANDQNIQAAGNEWSIDRMFEYGNGAQSNGQEGQQEQRNQHQQQQQYDTLDFNNVDNDCSSSFSSPNSVVNSASSTTSDMDQMATSQYQQPSVQQMGLNGYPVTPPNNQNGQTDLDSPIDVKKEDPFSPLLAHRGGSQVINTKNSKVAKPRKEKTSHNMIEKRYRTNINDKIFALRDCVPALRCVVSGNKNEDLEGLTPASKLNKATVLTKATEYIIHLQARNNSLAKEVEELRKLLKQQPMGSNMNKNMDLNTNVMQQYPTNYSYEMQPPNAPQQSGKMASKVMMMSMAGLMGAGMMGGADDGSRGLSGAAVPLFSSLSQYQLGTLTLSSIIFGVKLFLIVSTIAYVLFPALFASDHHQNQKLRQQVLPPAHLRKQTWQASCQSLRLPAGDDTTSKVLSLGSTILEVFITSLIGSDVYSAVKRPFLRTNEPENKSEIILRALDSQLSGGDVECNDARLTSSFLQGFMTTATATRYMTQALEAKVLSLNPSRRGEHICNFFAQHLWKSAQKFANKNKDTLVPHLFELLNQPDALSVHDPAQRLRNLSLGLPTNFQCEFRNKDSGVETVASDSSINSALNAYASWYAFAYVQQVLVEFVSDGCKINEDMKRKLRIAETIAPPNSNALRRVRVTIALLQGAETPDYLSEVMEFIKQNIAHYRTERSIQSTDEDSESISSISSTELEYDEHTNDKMLMPHVGGENTSIITTDSRIALHCSFIMFYMSKGEFSHALQLVNSLGIEADAEPGLLSFVALFTMLKSVQKVAIESRVASLSKLESLAAVARLWVGSEDAEAAGLGLEERRELVGEMVNLSILVGGFDSDEGYGSV